MKTPIPVLGVDVSKLTLDVKLSSEKRARQQWKKVANTLEGLEQVQQWLTSQGITQVHVCLEATGTYSDLAAQFFCAQGHQVSVINPFRLAAFRASEGLSSKTDRQDALVLACFGEQKRPALWQPTPPVIAHMQVLVARMQDLQQMTQQERNRLENGRLDAQTRQDITEHLTWLTQQRAQTEARLVALVKQSPACLPEEDLPGPQQSLTPQQACELIDSIPSLGPLTAMRLYSVYWDQQRFATAGSLVTYAGISPTQHESGTSVHGQASISRRGNAQVRHWLYLCAIGAGTHDPDFRRWKEELKARGKPGKLIIVALMRKLLHIVHGVLTSGERYDPRKAWPTHYPTAQPERLAA